MSVASAKSKTDEESSSASSSKETATSDLRCVFFSEFHVDAGPRITYQYPPNFITKDRFDLIHHFVITRPELANRMISFEAFDLRILGCPQRIVGAQYLRNTLQFNFCFVVSAQCVNTAAYEGVVRKLNRHFSTLEQESGFLASEDERRRPLEDILREIYENLSLTGRCVLNVGDCSCIYLKLTTRLESSSDIADWDVPVLLEDRLPEVLDLTSQQIRPYINGTNHVSQIAALADVDVKVVKACLQNLRFFQVVQTLPAFLFSNSYFCLPRVRELLKDKKLKEECLRYVLEGNNGTVTVSNIYRLYSAMTHGTRVRDLIALFPSLVNRVDLRRLIQFGELEGLIKRVHIYPIVLQGSRAIPGGLQSSALRPFAEMMDGLHSLDEIACVSGIPVTELERKIEADANICLVWR